MEECEISLVCLFVLCATVLISWYFLCVLSFPFVKFPVIVEMSHAVIQWVDNVIFVNVQCFYLAMHFLLTFVDIQNKLGSLARSKFLS